jgi:plastocyanin
MSCISNNGSIFDFILICFMKTEDLAGFMRRLGVLFGVLFLSMMVTSSAVQAHSADTFTVVIKETGLTPNSSQIAYNDSVVWHNTDSRENITHRIVFDFDGDGLFNGSDDWDSGELLSECDTATDNQSENGSEEPCAFTFLVWFNGTWGVGEYEYQDMLSDGTVLNGTIIVTEDVHVENSTAPAIGSSFGTFENTDDVGDEQEEEDEVDETRRLLLLVGGGSGLGALVLLIVLLKRSS